MQKKAAIGTVLVLIALVMMGISLTMPWYNEELTAEDQDSFVKAELFFDRAKETYKGEIYGVESEISFELNYDNETFKDKNYVPVFRTAQLMVFLGIIGCIIGLIGAAMVTMGKLSSKIGTILILLAVILSFLAPIYVMTALPAAFKEDHPPGTLDVFYTDKMGTDFFGSEDMETGEENITEKITWGGAIGWFLSIIAAVNCIIALVLVAKSKPKPQAFSIEGTIAPGMAPADQIPTFTIEPETPGAIPMAQPVMETKPTGEEFTCPQCSKIFIVALEKRPLHIKCPYCGLEGIVD